MKKTRIILLSLILVFCSVFCFACNGDGKDKTPDNGTNGQEIGIVEIQE